MLKAMRTGAQSVFIKFALFGMLLAAMLGLALMDSQGSFLNSLSDTAVARIGSNKISAAQLERMVSSNLRQQNISRSDAIKAGLPQQILLQEINGRLYGMAADDMGLLVDDATAAKSLHSFLQPLIAQGLTAKDALNRMLTDMGMSEAMLVSVLRTQTATDTLVNFVSGGTRAPQQLIDDAVKYRYESRKGEYFKLTSADPTVKPAAPSEDALNAYYKTIASRFALPEYRDIAVLKLDRQALGVAVKVEETDVRKHYDDHKADYTAPETRIIEQVVAKDETSAQSIYAAALKTKNVQKAAQGLGNYIKPRSFAEKDLPVELSPAAFKADEGAIVAPVHSALGWHVLHVVKIEPSAVKPYDSVKAEIENNLTADKSAEALYEKSNAIDDMLAGGKTLEDVAAQFNLKPILIDRIDIKGMGADGKKNDGSLPVFDKVLDQTFHMSKGETSTLIEAPSGEFLSVNLRDIHPSEDQPLDKVRAQVLESWKEKQAADVRSTYAATIAARLKSGETFDKIAVSASKTAIATEFISRAAEAADKAKLAPEAVSALFSLGKIGETTSLAVDDGVMVLRLIERRIDIPQEQNVEETTALRNMLDRAIKGDILEQYRTHLMAHYDVTINDTLVREGYKPKEDDGAEDF